MKILIIDDEKAVCDYLTQVAMARGYSDIETAANGEDALSMVIRGEFDLITVDLQMPGVSGLEIIAMLRNMCPHAIIAVISGYIPVEVSNEVAGCVDVMIGKPVSVDTFSQLLAGADEIGKTMERIRRLGTAPIAARQ
jgi:YesN/AraC family two-component response regulator